MYQPSFFDDTEQSLYNKSIKLIQDFESIALKRNPLGYVVGYSGGKDSDVLVDLFRKSGVKFIVIHNHTTLDAPETVYYVRKKFAEWEAAGMTCEIFYPDKSFWALCLQKKMLPSRRVRFCCSELKERDNPELRFATHSFGVRKAESVRRSLHRDSIELRDRKDYSDIQRFHFDNGENVKQMDACYTKNYHIINPLAYWTDNFLWHYIESEKIEINPLYKQGFCRVGCIGCPFASKHRIEEFECYPKYKALYIKLCDKIMQERIAQGLPNKHGFKMGEEYFNWWLYEELPEELPHGESLFDMEDEY